MKIDLPILVVGFNRPRLLETRLNEISRLKGVPRVYISIDGGSNSDVTRDTLELIENFKNHSELEIISKMYSANLGIANHLPRAIDDVFIKEENLLILEDDISITGNAYISFKLGIEILASNSNLMTVGGFCASPWPLEKIINNSWRVSPYFSAWGWATNRAKWQLYRRRISADEISYNWKIREGYNLSSFQEEIWKQRFLRSAKNPNFTWDIPMQLSSFSSDQYHLLPRFRIVENDGFNIEGAINTTSDRPFWMKDQRISSKIARNFSGNKWAAEFWRFMDSCTIGGDNRILIKWRDIRNAVERFRKISPW